MKIVLPMLLALLLPCLAHADVTPEAAAAAAPSDAIVPLSQVPVGGHFVVYGELYLRTNLSAPWAPQQSLVVLLDGGPLERGRAFGMSPSTVVLWIR